MSPDQLRSYLAGRGRRARLARSLGRHRNTIANWLDGSTEIPPELPLALCELERRRVERAGLGHRSCPACEGIAVEDDGLDDRYGCVLCGGRVDPDEAPTKGPRP